MIPDYQSLMLPLLKLVSDGQEHKYRDLIESLAIEFEVKDEERKELLASGNQAIFDNRVGWAKTYLKKSDYNKINLLYIFVFTIFLIIKILIFDLSRIDSFSSFFIVLFMVGMIFLIKFLIEEIRLFIKFKSDPKTF